MIAPVLRRLVRLGAPLRALARAFALGGRVTWERISPVVRPVVVRVADRAVAAGRAAVAATKAAAARTRDLAKALWSAFAAAVERAAIAVRPELAVGAVAAVAAIALAASQFADYRVIEIITVELDPRTAGSAHAYLLLPVALAALAAVAVGVMHQRWEMGRIAAAAGAIAVAVALAVDMPQGLDEGVHAERYAEASATLTTGFYVELFSGLTLILTGLLLSRYLREARPVRERAASPATAGAQLLEGIA